MSYYPELGEVLEGFADRYTRHTEIGRALMVSSEELQTLSDFLVRGIVDWVGVAGASVDGDRPALGAFLDEFANQYSRAGAVEVTEEEMIGLGLFFARGLVGWVLKLDQDRGRFKGFNEIVERKRSGSSGPVSRPLIASAL